MGMPSEFSSLFSKLTKIEGFASMVLPKKSRSVIGAPAPPIPERKLKTSSRLSVKRSTDGKSAICCVEFCATSVRRGSV